jgi:hypothetical protein
LLLPFITGPVAVPTGGTLVFEVPGVMLPSERFNFGGFIGPELGAELAGPGLAGAVEPLPLESDFGVAGGCVSLPLFAESVAAPIPESFVTIDLVPCVELSPP